MITGEHELQEGDEVSFFAIDLIKKKAKRQAKLHKLKASCCCTVVSVGFCCFCKMSYQQRKKISVIVKKIIFGGKMVN